jgi:hypothetical protein
MTTTLKSNWMGSRTSSPTIFRSSSKGNVFTRSEKVAIIFKRKEAQERKNARQELIMKERSKVKAEKESRDRFFSSVRVLSDNPTAKVRHSKDGLFIQPRVNGSFGPKINL